MALADFGRDPRSSDSLKAAEFLFCQVNNAQFPVGQILQHLNTTASIGEAVKTFGTEFSKFYHKGSFLQKKRKNCSQNLHVLRLQAIITPQCLQISGHSLPN